MKYFLLFNILLVSFSLNAQILKGKVLDAVTGDAIIYANVTYLEKDIGTYTNEDGKFSLKIDDTENIIITALGYEDNLIVLNKISIDSEITVFKLNPSLESLQEVIITNKKKRYTNSKKVGDNKKLKVRTSLPFGYEFANYIENPYKAEGIVEEVIISLNKNKEYDYLSTFNIKFYEYDNLKKQPGKLIHYENFIVQPENKTYHLIIDVSELSILYPEDGICIGVEIVNRDYDEPLKSMGIMAPKINFTHTEKKIVTWSRYRNKEWKVSTRKSPFRDDFINGLINLNVKIEK